MLNRNFEIKKYDLYISYHAAQLKEVEKVIKSFKNANLKMWHEHDLFETDLEALQSSFMFVCFPSKEYKKNINNKIEYSIARQKEMKIITFLQNEEADQVRNNEKDNHIKVNLKRISHKELSMFAKGIRREMDQLSSRLLIRNKQDEMEKIMKKFRKTYETTISSCSYR
jgi:hypothetical protein